MRAAMYARCGGPEVIEIRDVDKPSLAQNEILVHVRTSSVNPVDWHMVTGTPLIARPAFGMFKPRGKNLGTDYAGTVEAVGAQVESFRVGDHVFGTRTGAWAEYVSVPEDRGIVAKPGNLTFEEAGAMGVAGLTALQALRDHGRLQAGQKVLINGAAGGVGTFAVQLSKAFGAHVTGVTSTRNVELVRSIGADRVFDYTREDFTRAGEGYDLYIDIAGSRSWSEVRRVLQPKATVVVVGGPSGGSFFGPVVSLLRLRLGAVRASQRVVNFVARTRQQDLEVMKDLTAAGKVKEAIDRSYQLSRIAEACAYAITGHARAKIAISI